MPPPSTMGRDAQVIRVLRRLARERGEAAPQLALSELAEACDTSVDTVRRSVRRLDIAGRLEVLPQIGPRGGSMPSRYMPEPVTEGESAGELHGDLFAAQSLSPAATAHPSHGVGSRSVDQDHAPAVERWAR